MTQTTVLEDILKELKRTKKRRFPDHIVAQAATVVKESSLLIEIAHDLKYEKGLSQENITDKIIFMEVAAITTAAVAIRFIEELKKEKK